MDFKLLILWRGYLLVVLSIFIAIITELDKLYPEIGLSVFLKIEYQNEGLLISYTIIAYVIYTIFKKIKDKLKELKNEE